MRYMKLPVLFFQKDFKTTLVAYITVLNNWMRNTIQKI